FRAGIRVHSGRRYEDREVDIAVDAVAVRVFVHRVRRVVSAALVLAFGGARERDEDRRKSEKSPTKHYGRVYPRRMRFAWLCSCLFLAACSNDKFDGDAGDGSAT